jgi:predicted phage terminase large subunit-like protein
MDYPTLKRAVIEQAQLWSAAVIVIEDRASGTQLIQELAYEGGYNIQSYQPGPNQDKVMRMYACCNLIENGFVYLPEKADWLTEYLNELTISSASFSNGGKIPTKFTCDGSDVSPCAYVDSSAFRNAKLHIDCR